MTTEEELDVLKRRIKELEQLVAKQGDLINKLDEGQCNADTLLSDVSKRVNTLYTQYELECEFPAHRKTKTIVYRE